MKVQLLFFLLLASPALAFAQQTSCPWLTVGTAAHALGGDVSLAASVAGNWDGTCDFVRTEKPSQSIHILIGKTDTHPCPAHSPAAKTLGNEAVQCRGARTPGSQAETVAGRMRDVYFVITMTGISGDSRPAANDGMDHPTPLQRVAEQVVGSLY